MNVPTANALLGYPRDARLLIVNADDFGMGQNVNAAIAHAVDAGLVGSASLMVPCPWAYGAMAFLAARPGLSFAIHLTMLRDFEPYRWGPVSPVEDVRSLVDRNGHFQIWADRGVVLRDAVIGEVEVEFRAQIDRVLDAGLAPSHLDWHSLADGGREDLFDLTVRLAKEYGLAMRVHDRQHGETLRASGLPTVDHPVLDSYHMDPATKTERYLELLRTLPEGLSEWAVHPSIGSDEARALEPEMWRTRRADYAFLVSTAAQEAIQAEGIVLLDYRELQDAWKGAGAS
ncbi:MAG TPA: polysaccharide deacetylase family protein [Thermomicrobiales bacterium]|nr:polysaccharide deacetylase family protein [Thermomicrobiales bacterium]